MTPALLSALILGCALLLFVSERVRHDLVALIALFACVLAGLVKPGEAFDGFADPAVIAVAAVLIIGRAVELSGVASFITRITIPSRASFGVRLTALLFVSMALSAFMNNIAALVITMPIAMTIAREAKRPAGAILMPLSFATILGGMTTLIGTPANLILSSVRQKELGEPFGFFSMTGVGVAVCITGGLYLALIGWRLLPQRNTQEQAGRPPWRVYELAVAENGQSLPSTRNILREAGARMLAAFRRGQPIPTPETGAFHAGDHLLVVSREDSATVAEKTGLIDHSRSRDGEAPDSITARVVVGHGSPLAGGGISQLATRSNNSLRVIAAGPRAAKTKVPLAQLRIKPGDQLFVRGSQQALAGQLADARLMEIDRFDPMPLQSRYSVFTALVFFASIIAIVGFDISPALAFMGAAIVLTARRAIPSGEIYSSIDWSVIVLLGAMIPVGQSFENSGAAAIAAQWLGDALQGQSLFITLSAICTATLLLSIFLNNVATALVMGPLAIKVAHLLQINPDAALLAVLIGASSDFLTPIGHHNNLLIMGPGGYRFSDYIRMGALMVVIVVTTTALVLSFYA